MSSLSKKLLGRKILIAMACASLLTGYSATAGATTAEELKNYITTTSVLAKFELNSQVSVSGNIGTTAGEDKEKTVEFKGYTVAGSGTGTGFTVADGYILNLTGATTGSTSSTLSGFTTGVYVNSGGTANVTDMTLEGYVEGAGTVKIGGTTTIKAAATGGDDNGGLKANGTLTVEVADGGTLNSNIIASGSGNTVSMKAEDVTIHGTEYAEIINAYNGGSIQINDTNSEQKLEIVSETNNNQGISSYINADVKIYGLKSLNVTRTALGKGLNAVYSSSGSNVTINKAGDQLLTVISAQAAPLDKDNDHNAAVMGLYSTWYTGSGENKKFSTLNAYGIKEITTIGAGKYSQSYAVYETFGSTLNVNTASDNLEGKISAQADYYAVGIVAAGGNVQVCGMQEIKAVATGDEDRDVKGIAYGVNAYAENTYSSPNTKANLTINAEGSEHGTSIIAQSTSSDDPSKSWDAYAMGVYSRDETAVKLYGIKDIKAQAKGVAFAVYSYGSSATQKSNVLIDSTGVISGEATDASSEAYGIYSYLYSDVQIEGNATTEIKAVSTGEGGEAYAVFADGSGATVTVNEAKAITAEGSSAYAVYATSGGSVTIGSSGKTVDITGDILTKGASSTTSTTTVAGNVAASSIVSREEGVTTINKDLVTGTVNIATAVENGGFVQGTMALGKSAKMYIGGENLNVTITSVADPIGSAGDPIAYAYGVHTATNTLDVEDADRAHTIINATNTNITITDADGNVTKGGVAFTAMSKGILEVDSNLTAKASAVLSTRGYAKTTINASEDKTVQLDGDIEFDYDASTSGSDIDASVDLRLTNENSYLTGKIIKTGDAPASQATVTGMNLTLKNDATWNMTGDSFVNVLTAANSSIVSTDESLATLTLTGANENTATDSMVKANIAIASDATLALTNTVVTGKVTNDNVLNLSGGSIDGTVTSSSANGKLNIVGDTTLASMVSKQDITVVAGSTLTVNSDKEYLDTTDNVTLSGKLDMSDSAGTINKIAVNSFKAEQGSSISVDIHLSDTKDTSDTVETTEKATGTVAIGSANIILDGTFEVGGTRIIPIFTNAADDFEMTGTVTATSDGYLYKFTQVKVERGKVYVTKDYAGSLAAIVQNKTISGYEMGNIATYSLTKDYTSEEDLGTLTKASGASSRNFTINGNEHTIDGGSHAGITVNSGDSLTLTKVIMENFAGNVVNNAGTLTTDDLTYIEGNVTNSGDFTNNGALLGEVVNSGTLTNSGVLIGSIVNTGTLTTTADGLVGAAENKKELVLTSGELASDIAGSGTTTIAGNVTSDKSIDNAVAVNAGSSFTNSGDVNGGVTNEGQLTLEGKATVSGALTNNGTTYVTGDDVVLNGGTSKFAATGTTNITGKLTATTGVLSFAGTDNFVLQPGSTLVTRACNFVDETNLTVVDEARNAAKIADTANLDLVFDTHQEYYAANLKEVQEAYGSTGVSFLNAELKLRNDDELKEQLVIKRDTDDTSTSITIGGKPQVVDQSNNVKEVAVTKVPENYVTVVQQKVNAGEPTIQSVDKVEVNNTSFTSKGFQVKDTGSGTVAITATNGANITLVGGSLAEETLVKNEDNTKNLSTDLIVEEGATINVGMSINTKAQKGTINSVKVEGNHALDGNSWEKTDYIYNKLTVDTSEAAQVKVLNACLTVKELTAGNGTIYVDPSYVAIAEVAGNKLNTNIYVSTGSVVNIGGTDASELQAIAKEAGLTPTEASTGFTVDGMESMLNLAGNYTLASGKCLIVDCAVDSAGVDANNYTNADVYFGAMSLLVVNGKATNAEKAALTVDGQSVAVENGAKLYLRNAKPGETYRIVSGAGELDVANAWGNDGKEISSESTTLYASRLLKYMPVFENGTGFSYSIKTATTLDPSKFAGSLAYNSLKEMADNSIVDTESTYGGVKFLSRATDATYIGDAQMVPVQNELTDLAGTVGVQHNALRTSDLTADAIGAHLTQVKCESTDLWATPLRSNMSYTGRSEAINNVTGLVVGYDKGTKDGRFGVAIQGGWGTSHSEGTVSYSQNKNKFAGVSLYGSRKIGAFDLKASLGYTKYGNDVRTTLPAGLGMGSVETDIDANTWTADVRLEREIVTKGAAITPHAGLRYTRIHTNSYDNYIVSGDSQTQNLVQIPLGVTFAWNMLKKDGWNLKPYVDLSFVPVLGNKDSDGKVRFTGLTSVNNFATRIIDSTSWAVAAGFTAEKGKFGMGLNYYLQKGSNETNNTVALNLNWKF